MALKVKFDQGASTREQLMVAASVEADIVNAMKFNGESFVADCRNQVQDHGQGTYIDDTGNLRGSILYFILKDGKIIHESLEGTEAGKQAARAELDKITKRSGYQLIGIAGMNYASHVESKGYNVMSLQADVTIVELNVDYKAIERKYKR